MNIVVVTDIPSPHQVELFNELVAAGGCDLSVVYARRSDPCRSWRMPDLMHEHCFLDSDDPKISAGWVGNSELAIFSGYRLPGVDRLLRDRSRSGHPWVFWGERPGFRLPTWIGRWYRAWALGALHRSAVPIWGIGEWAIEGYKREFGAQRLYINIPYFSDLGRFLDIERPIVGKAVRRFLFSGRFIKLKGVDLLVSAFRRLCSEGFEVQLHFLGSGPLEQEIHDGLSGTAEHVHFHGFKQWHELADVYAQGDVLCAPSRWRDGWGMIVPEGLAAGMPVISTERTGAARELLVPGENGWLIPADCGESLYAAMREAASLSDERLRKMSCNARESARRQDVTAGVERFVNAANETLHAWEER